MIGKVKDIEIMELGVKVTNNLQFGILTSDTDIELQQKNT